MVTERDDARGKVRKAQRLPLFWGDPMGRLLFGDLTEIIIGAAFKVHNILGPSLTENAYKNALVVQLRLLGLLVETEKEVPLSFANQEVGTQRVDLLVEEKIIVETKAIHRIHPDHPRKLLSTLKNTKHQLGLVINFGQSVQIKRIINTVQHK